jgi:pyruvate formate lyase activating enzyme
LEHGEHDRRVEHPGKVRHVNNGTVGKVFDIQGFTVNDGPGIRTEVFLKGCPLRCLWCHSPESQAFEPQVVWFEMRCIGVKYCGQCLDVCPTGALKKGETKFSQIEKTEIELVTIDREMCDDCGKCTEACPSNALAMAGTDMTVDEVMKRIERDRPYYLKSGGGPTVSGGEPMSQHTFLAALLKECKDKGLNTCLDTTGYAKWERYEQVLPWVDLFLYDLKHMDSETHRRLTGVPNELILENARRLAAKGAAFQMRIPIIPGHNDSEEDLRASGEFCAELGAAVRIVQILPYHRLGIAKYERLQKKYELESIKPPSDEHMEWCKGIIESYGLQVKIH